MVDILLTQLQRNQLKYTMAASSGQPLISGFLIYTILMLCDKYSLNLLTAQKILRHNLHTFDNITSLIINVQ